METNLMIENTDKIALIGKSLKNGQTYQSYRDEVETHVANGTSTGPVQTEALANYTLLNHSRMKRGDKTVKISEEIEKKFKSFTRKQTWVVITESWCGDAAQTMPAINKVAQLAPNVDLQVVLRDENLELMNAFLTNGAMSIPKLIMLDHETNKLKEWGPRPSIATQLVNDYKAEHGGLTPEFKQDLQVWYNKDKSQSVISDLAELID